MIEKRIQGLRKRMEAQTEKIQEIFNTELENIKNRVEQYNNLNEKHTRRDQQRDK